MPLAGISSPSSFPAFSEDQHQGRRTLSFEDNRILPSLLGEHDANLALLEDRLGIEAVARGNLVTLIGPPESLAAAEAVLTSLYARAAEGEVIGPGDVEGAIRHTHAPLSQAHPPRKRTVTKRKREVSVAGVPARLRTRKRVVTARSPRQSAYLRAIAETELVFATGPAGTGKTYLAVAHAAARLERGETERIILSRPAVEAGERLGFLPGDMREKVDPYLRPLYDALYDVMSPERVDRDLETGAIEIAPLAFMRGRTLSHAIIILDEAQNCTPMQMKMFLTRLGEGSQMIITGDLSQTDLPPGRESGLDQAIRLLANIEGVRHIAFSNEDVVRHELVTRIVAAYDAAK